MKSALLDPRSATQQAPDKFCVEIVTTKGAILIDVDRSLAPIGVDRFYNLVRIGYYDETTFYRVAPGFVAQIGLHGDPAVTKVWREARIKDDPPKAPNLPGTLTFATSGKDARTTQIFINLRDNRRLDAMGFAVFGQARSLDVANTLYAGYGDSPPNGQGPVQGRIQREGNVYLRAEFPKLDSIQTAKLLGP